MIFTSRGARPRGSFFPAVWTAAGITFLLLLWEAASLAWGSDLLLPGPLPVLARLLELLPARRFLLSLARTFFRVTLGILISVPLGIAAGLAAGRSRAAAAALKPLFEVISATPVMSVILIAFLWFGAERTPVFTAFLVVFPVMAAAAIEGVRSVDPKLKELLDVYRIRGAARMGALYLPSVAPFILGGLRGSLSLCWKVVVASEVLVQPVRALGTGMQDAKARLETAELFAWTAGTVCAAAFSQGLLSLAVRAVRNRTVKARAGRILTAVKKSPGKRAGERTEGEKAGVIAVRNLSFGFGCKVIFRDLSLEIGSSALDNPTVILGPSGCGKTTLLRLVAGLLPPGEGGVSSGPVSFVFQEPRLLPWKTVLANAALSAGEGRGGEGEARRFLRLFSLGGRMDALPDELSGGERQRVNMARAFAPAAPVILMDEPFQSLDIPLRMKLMDLAVDIAGRTGRILLSVTHDPREAVYMGRRVIVLGRPPSGVVFDSGPVRSSGGLEEKLLAVLAAVTEGDLPTG
ncbi:MAG: ATP-binding cassette domain-containing protein [Treponema sp.]|jgi:ABC-type nitrate/sulfonate/bicarbonate transport system ATPase subunit/ABC-type nitrate/sulfonate/bicarbonate transport system permease component|nr:ATP-binding cassette domain-containing protein [Treponema sp.]